MKIFFCFLAFIMLRPDQAQTSIQFQSSAQQTALVELYTSEGCSSCPPAEAWFSRLKGDAGLWKEFVPVAFHVDYWDSLGWRDPWSKPEFSDRQREYAQRWNNNSVYTPGAVLNGREWGNWRSGNDNLKMPGQKTGVLSVRSTDTNRWQVDFSPTHKSGGEKYEIHAASLAGGLISEVKAGENRGRRLPHDFVVTTLESAVLTANGDSIRGEFVMSIKPIPAGMTLALAVWMTKVGDPEPLQATGGWIIPPTVSNPSR